MAWERSSTWNSWSGLHSWREGSAGQPASTGASSIEWQEWPSTANASSTPPVHQRSAGQPAREAKWNSSRTQWKEWPSSAGASSTAPVRQGSARKPAPDAATTATAAAPATEAMTSPASLGATAPTASTATAPAAALNHVQEYDWPLPALSEQPLPLPPRYWCPACSQGFVKWSQCRQHIYSTCKQNVIAVVASVDDEVLQNTCKTKPNFQ